MYKRNPTCSCHSYKDINEISLNERINCKSYWRNGYIFEDNKSRECECHKYYRLTERYNTLADKWLLPKTDELSKLKYKGSSDCFEKLMKLDDLIDSKHLKSVLVLITGSINSQKTTSIAHFITKLITREKTVEYINFNDIVKKIQDGEDISDYKNSDYFVIDDCFIGEIINFKSPYNTLYNIILHRSGTTILVSNLTENEIINGKNKPYYTEMIPQLFNRINMYNTRLEFTDNLEKLETFGNDKIDLWS